MILDPWSLLESVLIPLDIHGVGQHAFTCRTVFHALHLPLTLSTYTTVNQLCTQHVGTLVASLVYSTSTIYYIHRKP